MSFDVTSVLAPRGLAAGQIATLAWVLFAVSAGVFAVVVVALWAALRGNDATRRWLSRDAVVMAGGIAFPVVVLTLLLATGSRLTASALPPGTEPMVEIEVIGEQWWWRVVHAAPSGERIETANELRLPAGKKVRLMLKSSDVIHSLWIPNLAGKVDMIPGRTNVMHLEATAPGIFRGLCAEYCGGPHALMALPVIAMPAPEYEAWLSREAAPAHAPEQPGGALFRAAGCGACHRVRGTPADGTIGPDLTHVGSRRSVAIDLRPMNADNLRRFIAHGQAVKPGNRMPEFRIFRDEELSALSAYLVALR